MVFYLIMNHRVEERPLTRKITRAVTNIVAGNQKKLYMGNIKAKRDWGYAPEYVEFMWKMMQSKKPSDYTIGTGQAHSVEEFLKSAFKYVGLDYKKHIAIDKKYFRPTEVNHLIADCKKAKRELSWKPKITFDDLAKIMVDADMRAIGIAPIGKGDKI